MARTGFNMADYQSEYDNFKWNVPLEFNYGRDVIDKFAEDRSKIALFWEDEQGNTAKYTFGEIKNLSNQTGNLLRQKGIKQGDRVVVLLPRIPAWQIFMVACYKIGAVPIPGTEMLMPKDLEYRVNNSEAVAAITTDDYTWKFEEIKENCPSLKTLISVGKPKNKEETKETFDNDCSVGWVNWEQSIRTISRSLVVADTKAEDPAMMFYTSGTTGNPKGVVLPQRAIYAWRFQSRYWHDVKPDDLMWTTADTGWAKAGTGVLIGPWSWGTPVFFYNGPFNAKKRLELLEKYEVSIFCAAPTEIRYLLYEDIKSYNLSKLRHVTSAGEALNPEELSRWEGLTGLKVYDGYGLTEALMAIHNYPCLEVKIGSIGKPLPGYIIAIIDNNGNVLPQGEEGIIAIRKDNPNLFKGYWRNQVKTNERYIGDWFATGDRGMVDEDGYYWFKGRDDDIISSAGYRIGPSEVENALSMHPAVLESAAVGSLDLQRGEIVKAFIVLNKGYKPSDELIEELKQHCKKVTAPYKYPRQIEFVGSLPKTVSGKIKRKVLRIAEQNKKT